MNITIYTKPNCPQCSATKRQFDRRGFVYTAIDVTADARISDRLRNEGWRQMPVVLAGDESWSGYRPDKIRGLEAPDQ
ncbi:MAG TPA: NrdH-redoxin [Bifidobacterium sp.]|nr:NrdH-redoxin [Bifidobacterium sp.]